MSNPIKNLYIVVDEKGKYWSETLSTDDRDCQLKFAKGWMSRVENQIDHHLAWGIWGAFQKAGWQILEIELTEEVLNQFKNQKP